MHANIKNYIIVKYSKVINVHDMHYLVRKNLWDIYINQEMCRKNHSKSAENHFDSWLNNVDHNSPYKTTLVPARMFYVQFGAIEKISTW